MADGEAVSGTPVERGSVSYRTLLGNPSLLSVFLVSFSAAMGASAVPVALPEMTTAFAVTDARIGIVLTVFSLPGLVMKPAIGVFSDIYGRRRVVLPSLFMFGVTGVATFFVSTFPVLLGLRFLQGMAFAGTLPLTSTLIGDLYTGGTGSAAQGLRSSVNGIASTISPVVAGFLALFAWNYPFALFGLAFPAMILVYLYYPEPIEDTADADSPLSEITAEFRSYGRAIRTEAADLGLGILVVGGFALFFVKRGVKAFVPIFVVTGLGLGTSTAGFVLGVYGVTRVVTSPGAGEVAARFQRKTVLLGTLLLVVAGTSAIPFVGTVPALSVAVSVYAVGEAILNPVLNDAVATFAGDVHRGGIMSALSGFRTIANVVAPVLLGAILALGGFVSLFLFAAGVAAVYAVAVYLVL